MGAQQGIADYRYSREFPENVQGIITSLQARNHTSMRSGVMRMYGASPETLTWHEAIYNAQAGAWTVRNVRATANSTYDYDLKYTNLADMVSFFDTLGIMAAYDEAVDGMGEILDADDIPFKNIPMYHVDVAKDEGIPYDSAGRPLPATGGVIISEGSFAAKALDIAQASQGNLPAVIEKRAPVFNGLIGTQDVKLGLPAVVNNGHLQTLASIRNDSQKTGDTINGAGGALRHAADRDYALIDASTAPHLLRGGVVTALGAATYGSMAAFIAIGGPPTVLGVSLLIGGIAGGISTLIATCVSLAMLAEDWHTIDWSSPKASMGVHLGKLKRLERKFPEGSELRIDIESFRKEVELASAALQAHIAFNKASGNIFSRWSLGRAEKKFQRMCDRFNLLDSQRQWMIEGIKSPRSSRWDMNSFEHKLFSHIESRAHDIQKKMADLYKTMETAQNQLAANPHLLPHIK